MVLNTSEDNKVSFYKKLHKKCLSYQYQLFSKIDENLQHSINYSLYDAVDDSLKEYKSNVDSNFFESLFKSIDYLDISDIEKNELKSILVMHIIYHEVKKDNSKACQIVNDAITNIPSESINFDIHKYAVNGAILGFDRDKSCKDKVRDLVSSAILASKTGNKKLLAEHIVDSVSSLASQKIRSEYLDITQEAYTGAIKSLPKENSLENAIAIANSLVSKPKLPTLKDELCRGIGKNFYDCTNSHDYQDVVEKISKHNELIQNDKFINGFKDELRRQEVLSRHLH
jgi:hypothetical protein